MKKLYINKEFPYDCPVIELDSIKDYIVDIFEFKKNDTWDKNERAKRNRNIKNNCKDFQVWALLGSSNAEKWICLQVASSKSISREIISDIECMQPLEEKDNQPWNSYYHKGLFDAQYGQDVRCQKYREIRNLCDEFKIIAIQPDKYIQDDIEQFNRNKYSEVKFAVETKSLFWRPSGEEYRILKSIENL